MNEFGDERKLKLEGLLDPETAETAARIILDAEPIVLGITFWNCFRPWNVPERRICDNFFFLTVSGEERVTVNGEERILRRGDAMIVPEFIPHSFGLADGCGASQHFIAHALTGMSPGRIRSAVSLRPFLHPEHTEAVLTRLETIVAVRNTSPDARAKRDETTVQGADARGGAGGTLPLFGSAAERRAHCVGPCVHQREFRRLHRGCRHRGVCPGSAKCSSANFSGAKSA